MTIRRISSGPGLPAGFPFSLASEGNGILFISGMPALDADGKFVPGTFGEEAGRAWASIVAIAAASGPGRLARRPGTWCWPAPASGVPARGQDVAHPAPGVPGAWSPRFCGAGAGQLVQRRHRGLRGRGAQIG
jgi:hypothetical protein